MSISNAGPSFTYCPAGTWTTIFRGNIPFVGYFNVYPQVGTPSLPEFEYSAWSISPIFSRNGTSPAYTQTQIWIGPTGYAELKIRPKVASYFRAESV